jgi:hypothetical protein
LPRAVQGTACPSVIVRDQDKAKTSSSQKSPANTLVQVSLYFTGSDAINASH